jgi:hypothetical protein
MLIMAWNARRASPRIFDIANFKSSIIPVGSGRLLSVVGALIKVDFACMKMALNLLAPRHFQQTE